MSQRWWKPRYGPRYCQLFLREANPGGVAPINDRFGIFIPIGRAIAYDSLGEAYLKQGDKAQAVANYRKSLELDPGNENARKIIERAGG